MDVTKSGISASCQGPEDTISTTSYLDQGLWEAGAEEGGGDDGAVRVHEVRPGLGQPGQDVEALRGHETLRQLPAISERGLLISGSVLEQNLGTSPERRRAYAVEGAGVRVGVGGWLGKAQCVEEQVHYHFLEEVIIIQFI